MPLVNLRGRAVNWAISACCGAAFLLFGYDQGVMGGLLTGPAWVAQFPEINTNPGGGGSSSLQGTVVAIYEIGCLFGSIMAFCFGERLGRRKMIVLGCLILIVGAIMQTTAKGIPVLIAGRIVAGLGNGINTSTVPVYHSETSRADNRGRSIAIECSINSFGFMMSLWTDYGFSYVKSQASFRVPIGLQMVFAVAAIAFVTICPESPRWLLKHGREEEAHFVLDQLSIYHGDDREQVVASELAAIKEALQEEQANTLRNKKGEPIAAWRAVFTNGKERYIIRVLLGAGTQFMQQLGGINLISYYAPVVFQHSVGMSYNLSLLMGGFNGICNHLGSWPAIFLIDRIGRRKLMLWSVTWGMIFMAFLAGGTSKIAFGPGIVATVGIFGFSFTFSNGILSVPWLYPSEIAPLPIRTASGAIGSMSNWLFNFAVVEITPIAIANIGFKSYIVFCAFNAVFIPVIYFFYPETCGLTLEEIDLLFTGDKIRLKVTDEMRRQHHSQLQVVQAEKGESEFVEHRDAPGPARV